MRLDSRRYLGYSRTMSRPDTTFRDAMHFLQRQLNSGPKSVSYLILHGNLEGISRRTLYRAAEYLRVDRSRWGTWEQNAFVGTGEPIL